MKIHYLIIFDDFYFVMFDVLSVHQDSFYCYCIDDVYRLCNLKDVCYNHLHLIKATCIDEVEGLKND